jgi:methionine-gamma-lyase
MEDSKWRDAIERFYLRYGFATRALHSGEKIGQPQSKAHTNAIYQSSTFTFDSAEQGAQMFAGKQDGYIYTRLGNPTVIVLEAKLNALEGREVKLRDPENVRVSSLAFSSGMAAITAAMFAILQTGDTLIRGNVLYGCTHDLLSTILPRYGIRVITVDTSNLEEFEQVMSQNPQAKAVFFETPTNPTMSITDILKLSQIAKSINKDTIIVIDNTFATPYLQRPLSLGADVVIHSATKYLSGHANVIGGAIVTTVDEIKDKLYHIMKDMGACPSPFDAWLINLGLKTLPVRMERHCENAIRIAEFLEGHPGVERVYYPGLKSFAQHELAKRQMERFGGILSFELKGGYEAAKVLMNSVRIFTLAVSLGCVDSLIEHPATMTHASIPEPERLKIGITQGMIRLSIGLEDVEDLIGDLEGALERALK